MTPRAVLFRADGIEAAEAMPDDGPDLQALFEESSDFFDLTAGLPPGPAEVQSLFAALPEGKTYDDKHVISLFTKPEGLIGVIDVVRDYPVPGSWWMGLMLLRPAMRGRGKGGIVFRSFMEWAAAGGARDIYLSVKTQNEGAFKFWSRMGFEVAETRPPACLGARDSVVVVMRRGTTRRPPM